MQHYDKQFNSEENGIAEKTKLQKSVKNTLTELSTAASLEIAPKRLQADCCISKQTQGGNDHNQPPAMCGIFMPATFPGNGIILSGGHKIEDCLCRNMCSVTLCTLRDPGQIYICQNSKKQQGLTAMNANTHGTATPVAATPGASSDQCNNCLLPPQVVTDAIKQSKVDAASTGYHGCGNAYAQLLNQFHAAIFPQLINETGGNIAKISRLLGIHRESVVRYAKRAGFYDQLGAKRGGVQS